jgi:ankyrin repeat protein
MWAAAEGHSSVVELLIEHGADVEARSNGGFTPLLFAVRHGDGESVAWLLGAGASPNEKAADGTPVSFVAILNAHYDLAAFLLSHGADPDARDKTGQTLLHALVAARNDPGSQFQRPPVQTGALDTAALMRVLMARGANPNARTSKADTPATRKADSIDTRVNLEGATPFLLAALNSDIGAMRILSAAGADPRVPTYENTTALMVAAGLGSKPRDGGPSPAAVLAAVRLVVDLGGDVNAVNVHGQTALHGAVYRGVGEVIEFLVARGSALDARDSRGRTPAELADGFSDGQATVKHETAGALLRKLASHVNK